MSSRPLLLFVAALVLAAAGTAAGVLLFADNQDDAKHDRLQAEATDLALDAIAWSRKPSLMGGGDGTYALSRLNYQALGIAPEHDADGPFIATAHATLRFQNTDSDIPYVEAANADGQPIVRVAIYGPDAACLTPIALDTAPDADARPANCSSWR